VSGAAPEPPGPEGPGSSGASSLVRADQRAPRLGALGLVAIMLAACLGGGAVTAVYNFFFAPDPPDPPKTTTVVRSTPSVITAIRDLARLESASYHVERVIDLRDKQTSLFGLVQGEDALLLVAAGDVVAGVDLTSMRTGDITIDPEGKRASLLLPPPIVFSARLDNQRTYVHSRRTDVLAERAESLETRARQEAERTLREAALTSGILDRARSNAQRTITTLVRSLGYDQVDVRFREE
jgi:hypothetical protein